MARADYRVQMERHAGEWDVLPHGLPVPSWIDDADSRDGTYRGVARLSDEVLEGNRWPAFSGASLAELAQRCATLCALAVVGPRRRPRPREISVFFRKAIPVADPRGRPHVADGEPTLEWEAVAQQGGADIAIDVRMMRRARGAPAPVTAVEARARFDAVDDHAAIEDVERRTADYLVRLPRRLALPAYDAGFSDAEIRGSCVEPPGSLLAAAEQMLGNAGKIVRGDGAPADVEESMLIAEMSYRWLEDVSDGRATYTARSGPRTMDQKGRLWMNATAVLTLDGRTVGNAAGALVFHRSPPPGATM